MRMKELLLWLSIIAFAQVVLLGIGGTFLIEFIALSQNKSMLYSTAIICLALTGIILRLYLKVFNSIKEKRK
jgi:hypothetical protein